MFTSIKLNGFTELKDVLDIIEEDENEVKESLDDLIIKTNPIRFYIYPNFKNNKLLPPTFGLQINYRITDRFYADVFRVDKYRIIAMCKVNLSQEKWTSEKSKDFERLCRRCINFDCSVLPTNTDDESGGWAPSIGDRGTKLGLYHNTEVNPSTRDLKTNYYLIIHSCLPSDYIDELNQHDEDVDRDNYIFESGYQDNVGNVKSSVKLTTYEQHFDEKSFNFRALKIAKENACRMLHVASEILDLELESPVINQNLTYKPAIPNDWDSKLNDVTLFTKALKWYGKGVPIYPFTVLSNYDPKVSTSDLPPVELRGYPLGYCLYMYESTDANLFQKLVSDYEINFHKSIKKVDPIALTDYNTFRCYDYNSLKWYTGTSETNANFLTDEGTELGFKCYNFFSKEELIQKNYPEWKNVSGDAFPVVFPTVMINKPISQESINKCFSLTNGGHAMISLKPPEQLLYKEINTQYLLTENATRDLNIPPCNHFTPVKVFVSNYNNDISTYNFK